VTGFILLCYLQGLSSVTVVEIVMPNSPASLHLTAGMLSNNTKGKKKGCIPKYFEGIAVKHTGTQHG
jgi:hypothetical protein